MGHSNVGVDDVDHLSSGVQPALFLAIIEDQKIMPLVPRSYFGAVFGREKNITYIEHLNRFVIGRTKEL